MENNSLRRLFPTPRLLAMEGGGIEISDRRIKYLALAEGRFVLSWGEVKLPPGVVEQGDIKDEAALVQALERVRQKAHFSLAHVSLPEQKGYLFELSLPRAALEDLADAVALALPGYVPLPPAEVVFDCETDSAGTEEENVAIAVTAFPEGLARSYAEALCRAGFLPLSMELEPQAAARAVIPRSGKGAQLLIDYSATKTMLAVCVRGSVRLAASFNGSQPLDDALRARGISETELSAFKRDEGLGTADAEARSLVSRHLNQLCEEVGRHVRFWNARSGASREPVAAAWVSGGNANLRGLVEELSRTLGFPVQLADIWQNLPPRESLAVPPIEREESFRFASSLGLAMRSRNSAL